MKYDYLTPKAIAVLIDILDQGGEVVGFRDMSQRLNINYHALKTVLMHLEYNDLITRDSGPNNIMIIRLTPKGRKAAEILKQLLEVLEGDHA